MMIYIVKITNKKENYTSADAFSSCDLAGAFIKKYADNLTDDEIRHYKFITEKSVIDAPDYPFLGDWLKGLNKV